MRSLHRGVKDLLLSLELYLVRYIPFEELVPQTLINTYNLVRVKLQYGLLLSCMVSISTDALFLYTPILLDHNKYWFGVGVDKVLRNVVLVFRSLTDFSFLGDLLLSILIFFKALGSRAILGKRYLCLNIVIDFLAVLPMPQVVIPIIFSKKRVPRTFSSNWVHNLILLSQYVPKITRIYLLCEELKKSAGSIKKTVWINGTINVLLYLIASHVLGALWYFFSIQRELECWCHACKSHAGCVFTDFEYCNPNASRNLTFVNDFCRVDPPNATVFDYGIFLDAAQSGMLRKIEFPRKFMRCFWWGLRNLSSFGQNLQTSNNVWENFFTAAISVVGMILFLYLIGNLQRYMEMLTRRSEEIGEKMKIIEPEIKFRVNSCRHLKNEESTTLIAQQVRHVKYALEHGKDNLHLQDLEHHQTDDDITKSVQNLMTWESRILRQVNMKKMLIQRNAEHWLHTMKIPHVKRSAIMLYFRNRSQDITEVNLKTLLSILPLAHKRFLKHHLSFTALKKVKALENLDEKMFEVICDYLKPVVYPENSYIIRQGEPLDLILFVTQGIVWTYKCIINSDSIVNSTVSTINYLKEEDYFGEDLLDWALININNDKSLSSIPVSPTNIKSHTQVEALAFMAKDLRTVVSKCFWWKVPPSKGVDAKKLQRAFRDKIVAKVAKKHSSTRPQLIQPP